jgi:hypothetical protein
MSQNKTRQQDKAESFLLRLNSHILIRLTNFQELNNIKKTIRDRK